MATTSTGSARQLACGPPMATNTRDGPTACQEQTNMTSTRAGWKEPRTHSDSEPSTSPAATTSGTYEGGSRKSMGTRTSCVGTPAPEPTSNSTRETTA